MYMKVRAFHKIITFSVKKFQNYFIAKEKSSPKAALLHLIQYSLFQKFNVLEFITDYYGSLHLSSDLCALPDIETILHNNGVAIEMLNKQPIDKLKDHCAVTTMR